jgi:FkbM family methyltransferase
MLMKYYSQKEQDRWVIEEVFHRKRGGYFLDLAATDGIFLNNTFALETQYGWNGVCIEPNPFFFQRLNINRQCIRTNKCIDEKRGEVEFVLFNELGGIIDDDTDNNMAIRRRQIEDARSKGGVIRLATVPLASVLDEINAPSTIDFFSFDVEGAETRILRSFPFEKYRFLSLTVERPTPELNEILFANGYIFVKNLSFDSFYVHESLETVSQIKKETFVQIPPKDW